MNGANALKVFDVYYEGTIKALRRKNEELERSDAYSTICSLVEQSGCLTSSEQSLLTSAQEEKVLSVFRAFCEKKNQWDRYVAIMKGIKPCQSKFVLIDEVLKVVKKEGISERSFLSRLLKTVTEKERSAVISLVMQSFLGVFRASQDRVAQEMEQVTCTKEEMHAIADYIRLAELHMSLKKVSTSDSFVCVASESLDMCQKIIEGAKERSEDEKVYASFALVVHQQLQLIIEKFPSSLLRKERKQICSRLFEIMALGGASRLGFYQVNKMQPFNKGSIESIFFTLQHVVAIKDATKAKVLTVLLMSTLSEEQIKEVIVRHTFCGQRLCEYTSHTDLAERFLGRFTQDAKQVQQRVKEVENRVMDYFQIQEAAQHTSRQHAEQSKSEAPMLTEPVESPAKLFFSSPAVEQALEERVLLQEGQLDVEIYPLDDSRLVLEEVCEEDIM